MSLNANDLIPERVQELIRINSEMLEMEYIYDVIYGRTDRIEIIKPVLEESGLDFNPTIIMAIVFDDFWNYCVNKDNRERQSIKREMMLCCKRSLSDNYKAITATLTGTDKLAVALDTGNSTGSDAEDYALECALRIKDSIKIELGYSCSIGVSHYCNNSNYLWRAYEEAFNALQNGFFLGHSQIMLYDRATAMKRKRHKTSEFQSAKEELIVGTEPSFAPFEFPDGKDGKIIGFDIDLINAIGKKMGYKKITIKSMGFDALIPAINSGNIDAAIAGMSITDARKKQVNFSDPYYDSGLMAIVRKDNDTIHSLADLKGKKIGVQLGTTGAMEAEKIEGAKVTNFDTSDLACIELQNGNVDAVISDLPVLQYFLKQKGSSYAKAVGEPKKGDHYGIAVAKDKKDVLDGINKAMKELKDSGEYQKIYDKWFSESK